MALLPPYPPVPPPSGYNYSTGRLDYMKWTEKMANAVHSYGEFVEIFPAHAPAKPVPMMCFTIYASGYEYRFEDRTASIRFVVTPCDDILERLHAEHVKRSVCELTVIGDGRNVVCQGRIVGVQCDMSLDGNRLCALEVEIPGQPKNISQSEIEQVIQHKRDWLAQEISVSRRREDLKRIERRQRLPRLRFWRRVRLPTRLLFLRWVSKRQWEGLYRIDDERLWK